MSKTKLTVTIGIPAHNEERNIAAVLNKALAQNQKTWRLDKIIVVNDASVDKTVSIVNGFKNPKIKLIGNNRRLGKPLRINQLLKIVKSDVLVLLDADISLKNNRVVQNMVAGFDNSNVQLVSGSATPYKPKNFVGKILYAGIQIWNIARTDTKNAEMYFCEGQIKALKRDLYPKIKFPDNSADDVYPFLVLDDPSKFFYAHSAGAFYKLPLTFKDLYLQQKRYARSKKIQVTHFGREITSKYFVIRNREKMRATFINLFKNPVWTVLYMITMFFIRLTTSLNNNELNSRWEILTSTKK